MERRNAAGARLRGAPDAPYGLTPRGAVVLRALSSRRLVVLGFVTGALLGCTSESSSSGGEDGEPILTRDMEFGGIVEAADAVNATVYVSLDDGELLFGTEYVLTGGDVLDPCVAGRCRRLVHDTNIIVDPLIPTGYKNTFPYVPDADYVVSFSRGVGEAAPTSVVTLPRPFEVTLPVADQQFTDGESVAVAWSPSGTGESVYAWTDAKCDHEDGVVSVLARSRTRDLVPVKYVPSSR